MAIPDLQAGMLPLQRLAADGADHTLNEVVPMDSNDWTSRDPEITSDFSREAHEYVAKIESKIVLIEGLMLAQLKVDFGVGVTTEKTYEVKRIDSDLFESI
jgi:hypothetical protein